MCGKAIYKPTNYYLEVFMKPQNDEMSLVEILLTYALSGQPPFW
jgi:hypothetical protein